MDMRKRLRSLVDEDFSPPAWIFTPACWRVGTASGYLVQQYQFCLETTSVGLGNTRPEKSAFDGALCCLVCRGRRLDVLYWPAEGRCQGLAKHIQKKSTNSKPFVVQSHMNSGFRAKHNSSKVKTTPWSDQIVMSTRRFVSKLFAGQVWKQSVRYLTLEALTWRPHEFNRLLTVWLVCQSRSKVPWVKTSPWLVCACWLWPCWCWAVPPTVSFCRRPPTRGSTTMETWSGETVVSRHVACFLSRYLLRLLLFSILFKWSEKNL